MGDQIIAINNHPTVKTIEQKSHLITKSASDQVLLKLVRRLASIQHHSKCSTSTSPAVNDVNFQKTSSVHSLLNDKQDNLSNYLDDKLELNNNEVMLENLNLHCDEKNLIVNNNNMGANVSSRHHEKGLSGRRTQSSVNLYNNEKHVTTNGYSKCNKQDNIKTDSGQNNNNINNNNYNNMKIPPENIVSIKDRNKFCGSLPNHLDADNACENVFQQNASETTINNLLDHIEYVTVKPKSNTQAQLLHPQKPLPPYQQSSPFYSSSSRKGSIISSNNLGNSTFKTNHENKPDIQLKLPLHRTNIDTGCDQGYGSERSPEDEMPPPLLLMHEGQYKELLSSSHIPPNSVIQPNDLQQYWNYEKSNICGDFNFITKESIFFVQITKGPRGLGLSVSGGSDSNAPFPGLIRIKRLFPHQAAWATGMLQSGDILLAANGFSLSGLTNYEALEVLRTTPNFVTLTVCRPIDEQYRKLSPPTEPPKPPLRSSLQQVQLHQQLPYLLETLDPIQTHFSGEFEIILTKQQGSLGFTLRKEDESILGHYVRALVREPATTDGRIKPGDKIVAVNDIAISSMSHEEAVIFLRQSKDVVKLRLFRDDAQTPPLSAHSPMDSEYSGIFIDSPNKQKANLRPEAINLLSDIACRKQTPGEDSTSSSVKSSSTSPRRLRRGNKSNDNHEYRSNNSYIMSDAQSAYSDSETSTIISQGNSFQIQPSSCSNTYQKSIRCDNYQSHYCDKEHSVPASDTSCYGNGGHQNRPIFLDLTGETASTPMSTRKLRYRFSAAMANACELNNLDNEALDAPNAYTMSTNNVPNANSDFTSLPCETFLVACKTESDLNEDANAVYVKHFNHKSPMYASVQLPDGCDVTDSGEKKGPKSLIKWKGVTFSPENEGQSTPSIADSSCGATIGTSATPDTEKDLDFNGADSEGNKIFTVELNRGWNSRLGFSLKQDQSSSLTFISAIYSDSVAAKDGRLRVGDKVLMVNDESVEKLTTNEIIDLLRIIRGSISITVMRKLKNT